MSVTPDAPCTMYHDLASKFGQLKYICQWVQQVWKFIDPVIHASKAEQTAGWYAQVSFESLPLLQSQEDCQNCNLQ